VNNIVCEKTAASHAASHTSTDYQNKTQRSSQHENENSITALQYLRLST